MHIPFNPLLEKKKRVLNKTRRKASNSSTKVEEIMKKKLVYEYEFYNFVKSHFNDMYSKLFSE